MARHAVMEWCMRLDGSTGARVYELDGDFTDSHEAYELLERVRDDLRADPRLVVVDVTGIRLLTSAGVGLLAAILTAAEAAGVAFALAGPNTRARFLLRLVHLDSRLATFDTPSQALAALAHGTREPMA